ncbi:MAG TPA: YggS family pyridoxal phosphate-dependent enzyme [Usitatibacter sp.]|nr:YggS family pyridoxal phosphate-dependent enzyme [Usitatibacter sp.]
MSTIAANLQDVRRRISEALQGDRREVTLVAVSKTQSAEAIREAHAAGCRDFGENYVQEAIAKMAVLRDVPARWHFIGHLQTNKAKEVAMHFDWVHGVDRAKVAAALAKARPAQRGDLDVCLQVNISGEASKGGVDPADALALAREVAPMKGIRLRGLMGMASFTADAARQRAQFATLRRTLEEIRAQGLALDTLSMGMSGDMESAIAEGSTLVRIGTAIFGERRKP